MPRLHPAGRCFLASLVLAALLCAPPDLAAEVAERERRQVAMILFRGETPSELGFREKLAASPDFDVQLTVFNAEQSKERLKEIVSGLDRTKYDLIYTFGTMAAQFTLEKIKDLPVVFNVVQRPIEAGIVGSWESSGNNATGASNIVSMESAFRTLSLVMNIRKLGFIYYARDPAPKYQRADIEKVRKKFGFKVIDIPVQGVEDIPAALKQLVSARVDAVMFPSDSFIKANADRIMTALNQHRIPSIVIIPEMVKENGALISLGPDYRQLGHLAALAALEVLKGKAPAQVPIKTVQNLAISINLRTADRMGINFPLQLLSLATVIP